jgi:hypothetical protein
MKAKTKKYKLKDGTKPFRIKGGTFGPGDFVELNHKQAVAFRDKLQLSEKEVKELAADAQVRGTLIPITPESAPAASAKPTGETLDPNLDPSQDAGGTGGQGTNESGEGDQGEGGDGTGSTGRTGPPR